MMLLLIPRLVHNGARRPQKSKSNFFGTRTLEDKKDLDEIHFGDTLPRLIWMRDNIAGKDDKSTRVIP